MNQDIVDSINLLVPVEDIMDTLREKGQVDNPTGDYAKDAYNMCNIMTFVVGCILMDIDPDCGLEVKEGVFNMQGNHTWLVLDGTIIDPTACQFDDSLRPLHFTDTDDPMYHSVSSYTFSGWETTSPNVY
jgi:hypothetical protein